MGIKEVQLTSNSHYESIFSSLHQLRAEGQLCDITVQVDHQGDVQEFQAHRVMLAASSGYFRSTLLSSTQEKILLTDVHSNDFSKFLEFVYTGKVEVARNKIADVQEAARVLDCKGLSEVCADALSAGVLQKPKGKTCETKVKTEEEMCGDEKGLKIKGKNQAKSSKVRLSSKKDLIKRRCKANITQRKTVTRARRLRLKLSDSKVLHRRVYYSLKEPLQKEKQANTVSTEESEDRTEEGAPQGDEVEMAQEMFLGRDSPALNDWEFEDTGAGEDTEDSFLPLEGDEEQGGEKSEKAKRTSKAQFSCNKCQRTFHYEKSYLKHISTYHGVKADVIYRCETCTQTFANRSNLKIHEKHVHSNERLFSCDSCAKTFKRKKDVVRHSRQVHERNLQHMCPDCGKALSSKAALLQHERTHTGTKPYECNICRARFTQNSALKMHHRTHTGEKPFACDECDARFTQKHMLAYHKRSHTGEKPFMCEACGKSFASKEYLRHHSNIHTGSKPYKCSQCGRGFAQRNSLNQHLKIHTGERPYGCTYCEKQFTQLNALQRHQRIHTGEKPFMCGLCKRTFSDKSTLRRHTSIHDSEAPWKTYLVVLEGNMEEKTSKSPTKDKAEKPKPGAKKSPASRDAAAAGSSAEVISTNGTGETSSDAAVVSESVSVPSDWSGNGTIALVGHGGITVIHTDIPPGTQIQPIVSSSSSGTNLISIDVPFSLPPVSLSCDAPSTSLSVPALSVPVSHTLLGAVSDITDVSITSAVGAAAPPSEEAAHSEALHPDIQTVVVGQVSEEGQTSDVQTD